MKKTITLFTLFLLVMSLRINAQVSVFPYVQTGNPVGWTVIQGPILCYLNYALRNPDGVPLDTALVCNFYGQGAGVEAMVVSPAFNFTAVAKPIVNFYVAYRSYSTQDDSLQVLVSTDGGLNFINVPTPYRKSFSSTPSLATVASGTSEYNPTSESQWRHETIDLSLYGGQNNILIAFRAVSAFGNNLWIDNFIVTEADEYCASTVTAPGNYTCNPTATVVMNTVGLTSINNGNITDNPAGGVLSITEFDNQYPVPSRANPSIITNNPVTGATTQDGSRFTPNIIAPDKWFTITYTGNDYLGYANYNLELDLSSFLSVLDINKLYIVKRTDLTGGWVCLNTTVSGGSLVTSGLTDFCDFAVGGDSTSNPLPVELSSFVSVISGRNVTLNWTTASEINNHGFEVERSNVNGQTSNEWNKIGFISGNGTINSPKDYSFTDRNLSSGKYNYRLKQIDINGNYEYFNLSNEVNVGLPSKFELSQNYPNPFNPSTKINYDLPFDGNVSLKIYNMSGKEVSTIVNEVKTAGYYTVNFNASDLSSGVYFYTITANNFTATKKMMLLK